MKQPKEIIKIGQLEVRMLLDGSDTDNRQVVFEFIIPAGAKVPIPHYHKDVDELLFGLEGMTTSIVNGEKKETGAGDTLFIPRGAVHYHDNLSDKTAKTLCVLTPGNIDTAYFKEIAELMAAGGAPDPQKASEIMLRHGLVPAKG